MCHYVVRDCCEDSETFYQWKYVLCTLSGYGFVPETAEGRELSFERCAEGGSMIDKASAGGRKNNIHMSTLRDAIAGHTSPGFL